MSLRHYRQAEMIQQDFDPSVDTLIMAAVLKADPINLAKLEAAWPDIVADYRYRFNSGQGLLPGEKDYNPEYDENIRIQAEAVLSEEA